MLAGHVLTTRFQELTHTNSRHNPITKFTTPNLSPPLTNNVQTRHLINLTGRHYPFAAVLAQGDLRLGRRGAASTQTGFLVPTYTSCQKLPHVTRLQPFLFTSSFWLPSLFSLSPSVSNRPAEPRHTVVISRCIAWWK